MAAPAQVAHRRWPWFLAWLFLTVYFITPPREAYDHSLDKSNYATYAHFFAHRYQWGRDVIPMTGPFGFLLYGHTYSGEAYEARFVGELLLKGAFAVLVLSLFRRAGPGRIRWAWVAGLVLLIPTVDDLFHDYAILVATLVLLANLGRPNAPSLLGAVLLGALALFKGTHLITTAACFGSVVLLAVLQRRWPALLVFGATYLSSMAICWTLANQQLANLPAYLRGVRELSSGYNAAMGLEPLPIMGASGIALLAGLTALFVWQWIARVRGWPLRVTLLLLAGFTFIKWKHGFLRADGHVFIFFTSAAVIALTLALVLESDLLGGSRPPGTWSGRGILALSAAVIGFAVLASADFWLWRVYRIAADVPAALQRNVRFLAAPDRFRAPLEAQLGQHRREAHVPQIRNEIGQDPVDFFGFEQGLLLLNGFNYHPRPMGGGSFNVLTAWLQELNERFVRDPNRAPRWQVMKLQTLDDRLPAADDPLTLRAVLEEYSPVLMQRDYLLLKRRGMPAAPAGPVQISTQYVRPGQDIPVPDPGPGRMLCFTLRAPFSARGLLQAFLARPPELALRCTSALHPAGRTFALKPSLLRRPVILSPLLLDNSDVIQLFGDKPGNHVQSVRLIGGPGFDPDAMKLTFYTVPRPAPPEDCDIEEILTYIQHPLYNRAPRQLQTEETGIRELNKEPITIVHAPGRIEWDLQSDDQQVIFSYGLMPQTYLDGGQTDGVEFIVETVPPQGEPQAIFRRYLQPYTAAADRGMQRARVYLPPKLPAGSRLRIRTDPGPSGNGAWDQSYITRLQIKQGLPDPRQYVGFNVAPLPPGFAPNAEFALDGRPVRGVHPPAELLFPVPAGARRVVAAFGLMPGSYQGENQTDGVDFTFTVRRPDGSTLPLGRRLLEPLTKPTDRGIQAVEFKLPVLPEGSVLIFQTGPGAHQNLSWDWAVLQTLIVE